MNDAAMRTTLTIDDDLAALLERRARELGVSFEEVVNRTIRAGLVSASPKTVPHSFGLRPGVDPDRLNQLADELEAEASAAAAGRSRDPA